MYKQTIVSNRRNNMNVYQTKYMLDMKIFIYYEMHFLSCLIMINTCIYFKFTGACSSRSTPKPRPPTHSAMRPNITFQTYACPKAYAEW